MLARPQKPHLQNSTPLAQPQQGGLCNPVLRACGGMGGLGAGRSQLFRAPLFLAPLVRLRRLPPPGFRRRQWAHVTVPARPPAGGGAPGTGTAARAAASRGGGGRGRGRNCEVGGFPGARGAAAQRQERELAAAELVGVPRAARDLRPPGMGAPEVRSCPSPAAARAGKARVERRATLPGPGERAG